ncbi:hypothetical protein EXU57_06055 [Segetibacter sp. 3557_3]|uniref:hypothetical protein n=1 Tax=Segetibacter sp. 3557_3 TaxID=2547429 RepID=UPI001058C274|nr:hypothetical protein [Segetibacter sp. 3557_3]TDH28024.1 hypothetical protein EXU57_06055 [Segetibacter sp. 3557_3]
MKFTAALILTMLLAFAMCLFLPWWTIALAAMIVAVCIYQWPLRAFFAGFLALFLLWGMQSFFIDQQNGHLLASKVAQILPLGGSPFALVLVTAFVGALVAGMGALTGSLLRRAIEGSGARQMF